MSISAAIYGQGGGFEVPGPPCTCYGFLPSWSICFSRLEGNLLWNAATLQFWLPMSLAISLIWSAMFTKPKRLAECKANPAQ